MWRSIYLSAVLGISLSCPDLGFAKIKNVILMIGDGMGVQQVELLNLYTQKVLNRPSVFQVMANNGGVGLSATHPADGLVVDSACSATQLATGEPAGSEMIGLDAQGHRQQTVLELAGSMGRATGLVSDTRITHATPASFASHRPHRSLENAIASDLISGEVDLLLSGGLRHFLPQDSSKLAERYKQQLQQAQLPLKSKRKDNRNLLAEAEAAGFSLLFDRNGLSRFAQEPKRQQSELEPVLGLFAYSGLAPAFGSHKLEPSLAQMTDTAIQYLAQDKDGFFLMVESGQIDWAGHNNDAGWMLRELLRFEKALRVVLDWVAGRDDTLVVVTADHETGSFGVSYHTSRLPEPKSLPGKAFADRDYKPNFNFGKPSDLMTVAAQKKPFYEIFASFDALPKNQRDAKTLAESIEATTGFLLDDQEIQSLMKRRKNPYFTGQKHKYIGETMWAIEDFAAFYPYEESNRDALLARKLAHRQGMVWGTGTHTHAPVGVFTAGPEAAIKPFLGYQHHTLIGKRLKDAVRGSKLSKL